MTTIITRALIDAATLANRLIDPNVCVVEVDVNASAYNDWHIDGAVLWNLYADLKTPAYHTVAPLEVQNLLRRSGIRTESSVVFYGYAPAFAFWLLKLYQHPGPAYILNTSRQAWQSAGFPTSTVPAHPAVTDYSLGEPDARLRATAADVRSAIGRSRATLVDVRSQPEYDGEQFWPSGNADPAGRAGHLPRALHQPIDALYDAEGGFRPAAELRTVFSALGPAETHELITYCTIGGRAATAWFVLTQLLGFSTVRVYDGSWAEWGRTPGLPVETATHR